MSGPALSPDRALSPADPDNLVRDVRDLQRRVAELERRQGVALEKVAVEASAPAAASASVAEAVAPGNALPVVGRALLGIAGGYVLRALTESGTVSHAAGVTLGLAYAAAWLVFAARTPLAAKFAGAIAALTAMAIVAPLLWEATARLGAISTTTSAVALAGYAVMGAALARWRGVRPVAAIACAGAALTAMALLLTTHDVLPYALTLLLIAGVSEAEACRDVELPSRWVAAICADCAAALLAWLVARPGGVPEGYVATPRTPALMTVIALGVIYAASAVVRSLVRRREFEISEVMQTAVAALIAIGGAAGLVAGNGTARGPLGGCAIAGGAACYVAAFRLVSPDNKFNFRVWATYGLMLILYGTFLPLPRATSWMLWCACAVACCWAAAGARKPTLALHGAAFLVCAAAASGGAGDAFSELFGAGPDAYPWRVAAVLLGAALLAEAAVAGALQGDVSQLRRKVASLALSAVFVSTLAGVAVRALVTLWRRLGPGGAVPVHTLATISLAVLCALTAWTAARWGRKELAWLAYAGMFAGAWKVVGRDLPNERSLMLVVSLLFYGGALMFVPRALQKGRRERAPASS